MSPAISTVTEVKMTAMSEFQPIIDEITAICNSLGKLDENDGTYMRDRDCKPCLKEIIRHLASDSKSHVVRSTLGAMNIVKADLIPILVQYCDYTEGDPELFTTILRLLTNLTSSVVLLFENQEKPSDPEKIQVYNRLLKYLYNYKEAFATDESIWSTLNVHLRHNRDDEVTFERLVILIRNILHIPVDSTSDLGVHCDFDTHDMCLYRMEKSGMLETILELTCDSEKGSEFCFHLTEIIYLMLRDQNSETLSQAKPSVFKRKLDDSDADKKRYEELRTRDRRQRQISRQKADFERPRFKNSLFVVQNCRSISEMPQNVRKAIGATETIKFDDRKTDLRKARNMKPLSSQTSMSISDSNTKISKVSYGLKVFCKQFVEKVFSNYMQQIKHNLIQKRAQEHDESYYLWAIQFFTSFNRHMQMSIENISETLSTSTLHFIQILITTHQDKIKMEKKKFEDDSKRLHLALRAYREILATIRSIEPESEYFNTVEIIKKNIFTEVEYSSLILNLFLQYDEPKHTDHYLRDLIDTNYVFLEVYEMYAKSQDTPLHLILRYCCPDVVKAHLKVLKDFESNRNLTNESILKFLERIVFDCKQEVILFQASVFRCILDIMSYHSTIIGHDRFKALGRHLIQSFGDMANKRRWMYQELLFWKNANDSIEIENAVNPPPPPSPSAEQTNEEYIPGPSQQEEERLSDIEKELFGSDEDEDVEQSLLSGPHKIQSYDHDRPLSAISNNNQSNDDDDDNDNDNEAPSSLIRPRITLDSDDSNSLEQAQQMLESLSSSSGKHELHEQQEDISDVSDRLSDISELPSISDDDEIIDPPEGLEE